MRTKAAITMGLAAAMIWFAGAAVWFVRDEKTYAVLSAVAGAVCASAAVGYMLAKLDM